MNYKIGVDGGGSKTECILIDDSAQIIARHIAAGCNPSIVGADQARSIVTNALHALRAHSPNGRQSPQVTLLCMAGSPGFWQEYAAGLADFGQVTAYDDSLPVLELATGGGPGLVLHAGTGSFVAARAPDGSIHYAGGLGWRFGDSGSGYDIGRRAIAHTLLEQQGWAPPSRLTAAMRQHMGLVDGANAMRTIYSDASPNVKIAALAPTVLNLASEGDAAAGEVVVASTSELLDLARSVAVKLFPGTPLPAVRAGLSGPILAHPFVRSALTARAPFALTPVEESPVEGLRRMLLRLV